MDNVKLIARHFPAVRSKKLFLRQTSPCCNLSVLLLVKIPFPVSWPRPRRQRNSELSKLRIKRVHFPWKQRLLCICTAAKTDFMQYKITTFIHTSIIFTIAAASIEHTVIIAIGEICFHSLPIETIKLFSFYPLFHCNITESPVR